MGWACSTIRMVRCGIYLLLGSPCDVTFFDDSDATRKEALPGFRLSEHTGMMQLPREHDVV